MSLTVEPTKVVAHVFRQAARNNTLHALNFLAFFVGGTYGLVHSGHHPFFERLGWSVVGTALGWCAALWVAAWMARGFELVAAGDSKPRGNQTQKYQELQVKYQKLNQDWNALVDQLNAKGGRAFLEHARLYPPTPTISKSPFSDQELRTLLKFCHPDKHGGNLEASQITRRLLGLRTPSAS